jgi:hypothetical protein
MLTREIYIAEENNLFLLLGVNTAMTNLYPQRSRTLLQILLSKEVFISMLNLHPLPAFDWLHPLKEM